MIHCRRLVVIPVLLLFGCVNQQSDTSLVPDSPFGVSPASPTRTRAAYAPAPVETAARVDTLGRKILAANKQAGVKPLFRTIGVPQAEVFHYGTAEINITEGLVKQCQNDGQLAAILCTELGKMVAEREALAGPQVRQPDREPPLEVRIGNDNAGAFGPADQTHLAELAKYEKRRTRNDAVPLPLPDPQMLARTYLTQSGFAEKDLEDVAPLLRAAGATSNLEKQLSPNPTVRPWIH
jgi:hypothetical protein